MAGTTGVNVVLFLLCAAGVGVSYYAFFVGHSKATNEKYEAMCDISDKISCTKVFSSTYSKGFGVVAKYLGEKHILNQPNSVYGIAFYGLVALLSLTNISILAKFQLILAFASNILSVYLAYLLYFVIQSLCVLCVGTYVINFLILVVTFIKIKKLGKKPGKKAQKEASKQKKAAKKKN